jgi:diacylglycerol O-acyltransferase-1
VKNSIAVIDSGDLLKIFERVLKLAVPNTFIWLLAFYALFHSFLNLTAELLRFGDRLFYKAWWNAQDMRAYWRLWNLPVHNWVVRHLYCPALRTGMGPIGATIVVFFFSALLHEVLISVPMHRVSLHAFMGMFLQVPLVIITEWMRKVTGNPVFGNVTFWVVFCVLGQPILILLYAYAYVKNGISPTNI